MNKYLVVNADDFGLSEGVNEGIIRCHENGILTSASIIACSRAFEHAVGLSQKYSGLGVGIHLTLVEEHPVADAGKVRTLLGKEGRLTDNFKNFVFKYFSGRVNLNEIRLEFEEQIKKSVSAGIKPTHIDSHQHLHLLPAVFGVVAELAKKYGIRTIRVCRNFDSSVKSLMLNCFTRVALNSHDNGFLFADSLFGLKRSGRQDTDSVKEILNCVRPGISELMVHPGIMDNGYSKYYSHWNYKPEQEMDALCSEEIIQLIKKNSIVLTNFNQLRGKND